MIASLKIGIIGTGKIARIHAKTVKETLPGVSIDWVVSKSDERASAFAEEFNIPHLAGSYDAVFESAVDAVIICTPAPSHPSLIAKAAQAGKHIFCEKPIGYELEEIDNAMVYAKNAGTVLFIGFNRRFDPHFQAAHEAIQRGDIGKPEIIRITSRDPRAPSTENLTSTGAIFLETMIHDLDMARFLVGDEVKSLYVASEALINPSFKESGNVDTAIATLRFRNGALGTIDNSWRATYGYDQRAEILGSNGMYSVENITLPEDKGKEGIHGPLPLAFFPERYRESYQVELKEFVRCIIDGSPATVTAEDGRTATILALAARESCMTGASVDLSNFEAALKHA